MELKIKHNPGNTYTINGMIIAAKNYKDAIAEYLNRDNGSTPIFMKG